jgi:hypothetical protein
MRDKWKFVDSNILISVVIIYRHKVGFEGVCFKNTFELLDLYQPTANDVIYSVTNPDHHLLENPPKIQDDVAVQC